MAPPSERLLVVATLAHASRQPARRSWPAAPLAACCCWLGARRWSSRNAGGGAAHQQQRRTRAAWHSTDKRRRRRRRRLCWARRRRTTGSCRLRRRTSTATLRHPNRRQTTAKSRHPNRRQTTARLASWRCQARPLTRTWLSSEGARGAACTLCQREWAFFFFAARFRSSFSSSFYVRATGFLPLGSF